MSDLKNNKNKSKCDFCKYFVGRQCTAEKPDGNVNPFYCYDAKNEFYNTVIDRRKNTTKFRGKK